ncbi:MULTISPECIES: hypothetical protein [Streptomyces]|uniref:hypothetical protein n=1 Tax=Streptomyces TaxID=1883 RepID=UPI0033C3518C
MTEELRVLARVLRATGLVCRLTVEVTPGAVEVYVRPGETGGVATVDAVAAALGTAAGVTSVGGTTLYTASAALDGVGVAVVHLLCRPERPPAPRRTQTDDLVAALDTLAAWLPSLPASLDPSAVVTDTGAAIHAQLRFTDGPDAPGLVRMLTDGLPEAPWPARGADTTVLLGSLPLSIHRLMF